MGKQDEIPTGYTRVTEILSSYISFDNVPSESLQKATTRGSRVHDHCEYHALNLFVDEPDEECKEYVNSFKKWFDTMVDKVYHTELRLNHPIYKFSGKFDMLVHIKSDPADIITVLDIKTPQTKSLSWELQTAAYQILLEDVLDFKIGRRIALILNKDGKIAKPIEHTDHKKDKDLFLKCVEIHRFFKLKKKKCVDNHLTSSE